MESSQYLDSLIKTDHRYYPYFPGPSFVVDYHRTPAGSSFLLGFRNHWRYHLLVIANRSPYYF